jgi:hypothetical protein
MLRRKACEGDSEAVRALPLEQEYNMLQQHELLRRLRWISIGRQYDWTLKGLLYFVKDWCAQNLK